MKRIVVETKVQIEGYPEHLLNDADAYTKAQLFILFRDISSSQFVCQLPIVEVQKYKIALLLLKKLEKYHFMKAMQTAPHTWTRKSKTGRHAPSVGSWSTNYTSRQSIWSTNYTDR